MCYQKGFFRIFLKYRKNEKESNNSLDIITRSIG